MTDKQDWLDRWQQDRIAFHEAAVNPHLQTHIPQFGLPAGARIFVPLCGKAVDLMWLAQQGYEVIGIELSELAIGAFFAEQAIEFVYTKSERFGVYRSQRITLLQGDYFDLRGSDVEGCSLVYDRAALIAMSAAQRPDYCRHMLSILPPGAGMLLITFAYDQTEMSGPPYAVSDRELHWYYGERFAIDLIECNDILDERPRWREAGLTALTESVFRLQRNQ